MVYRGYSGVTRGVLEIWCFFCWVPEPPKSRQWWPRFPKYLQKGSQSEPGGVRNGVLEATCLQKVKYQIRTLFTTLRACRASQKRPIFGAWDLTMALKTITNTGPPKFLQIHIHISHFGQNMVPKASSKKSRNAPLNRPFWGPLLFGSAMEGYLCKM